MDLKNPQSGRELQGRPRKNTIREKIKFNSYKFDDSQTIDRQVDTLRRLASVCEFGDQTEDEILEKILTEYYNKDPNVREIVDQGKTVSLEQVLELIRARETSNELLQKTNRPREGGGTSDNPTQHKVVSKEEIDMIIDLTLKDGSPKSLKEVQTLLECKFHCSLSQDDKSYIEKVYTETLIELWLDEASENVMGQIDKPLERIEELSNVESLDSCLSLGSNLPYNSLMKELCKQTEYVKTLEKRLIMKFKSTFLSFLVLKSTYLQGEIHFHQTLIRTMKRSECVQDLCDSLNVTDILKSVEDESIPFKRFLLNIINSRVLNDSMGHFKAAAQAIVEQDRYYLMECVKNTIKAYLKSVVLTETLLDGRQLLEVKGEHIVISKTLQNIERTQRFCEIEEVRFVNAGVIHVNSDLNNKLWHGKNIVVYAETIIVNKDRNIIWDVSGQDAENEETKSDATTSDGIGLDGAEGKPGESGGSILLMCDEIENSSNWKIVSNGGKGGKGQDGGSGSNGKDGDYMNKIDFKRNFPPVSKVIDSSKKQHLEKTTLSVMNNIHSAKISTFGTLVPVSNDEFHAILVSCIKDLTDIYFETKTMTGCQISFSFYYPKSIFEFSFSQSFLLHKGSNGEPGKDGGKGGMGGKGGFAGEVKVKISENNEFTERGIIICANNGEDGKHGQSGACGKPGESGLDCGYIDSTKPRIPFVSSVQFPKYFLPSSRSCKRLTVVHHTEKGPERVYCPHTGQYAEISEVTKEFNQSLTMQEISSNKVMSESQCNVQVIRKKTIIPKRIMEQYKHRTSVIDCLKLTDIEKKIKQINEEITNEEMLQKEQTVQKTRITRKIDFCSNSKHEDNFRRAPEVINQSNACDSLHLNQSIEIACCSSADVSNLISLFQVDHDLQKFKSFWNTANIQAIYMSKDETTKEIQLLLSSKYQLVVLDHLEQTCLKLNSSLSHKIFNQNCVGSVENSLSVSRNQESFSDVEGFLCSDSLEKREIVLRKLKEFDDGNLCMQIFNLHFDDGGERDVIGKFLSDIYLNVYKKHYSWFKSIKAKNMQSKMLVLLNALKERGSQEMHSKLVNAFTKQSIHLRIDVEHKIHSDPLLNKLYEKYIEEVNKPFVWKSALLSKDTIIEKLKGVINVSVNQKGPSSVFYRELLAHLFKTNILMYTKNECEHMVLAHNHNPTADEVVHILIKDNHFLKLEIDEDTKKMITAHEEKGQVCNQIQLHIDSVKEQESYKEQLDTLLSDNSFFVNGYNGVSKSTEIRIKIKHMLMEDENVHYIANSFEPDEDRQLVKSRLTILKNEYVGYQSFLYYIALHMKTEGNQLSIKELCCIINFIVKSVVDSSSKTNLVSWIIASQHQTNWIVELLLFKLELYFKKLLEEEVKSSWRKNLQETNRETRMLLFEKLGNDQSLSRIESIDEVLILISQVKYYDVGLSHLCLAEWKYYLKDTFWTNQVRNTGNWTKEELRIASFYLATLENSVGKELCFRFIEIVKSVSNYINSEKVKLVILNTLKLLTNNETLFNDTLLGHLSQAKVFEWEEVVKKESFSSGEERNLNQLSKLIQNCSNTSKGIVTNIDDISKSVEKTSLLLEFLNCNIEESKLKTWISSLLDVFEGRVIPLFDKVKSCETELKLNNEMSRNLQKMQTSLMRLGHSHGSSTMQTSEDFLRNNLVEIFLATISASICMVFNKTLRNTQLLTIMTFLKTSGNVLGQVSTGEGKSFIIISVAIIKALSRSKVDIVTSSHVLAERDAKASKRLCGMFGIEVGHNCSQNIEERKSTYSKCCIVYGELSYFQRDFLMDRVYNNNILGDRTYETILVDEVDSMLLDKANNVLYLSHDIPGLDKLESLFVFIWRFLNMPSNENNYMEFFNVAQLKDRILYNIYGQITIEDVRNLDTSLEERYVLQTWAHLMKKGVIDSTGKILLRKFEELTLDEDVENHIPVDDVKYLIKKVINREKEFEVPNYLKSFVDDHLDKWIESAINATKMKNNIDYVVDVDRSDNSTVQNPNIIIVDRDTGTDMTNSQWDQGLHQFLQLKHGCRISPLTFKAVFISNVSYLKMYKTLFGLTGTLGSMSDRDLLKEVYEVQFVTIPTSKAKIFTEDVPILCSSPDDWSTKITENIYKVTNTRSALIICDTLSDVFTLKKHFEMFALKNKLPMRHVHTYTRDYEEFSIAESLDVGHVVISTNLAGRGTDIKLSDKLIDAGGLHVCLSFLPNNSRIEEQAFGRAARNGQPGSGQLTFLDYGENSVARYIDLKRERDVNEIFRVSDVKKYYNSKIKLEESMFHTFLEKYKSLRESKHCDKIKAILLMTCLDKWAFWLEKSTNSGTSLSVNELIESISQLTENDFDIWSCQIQDPFQLTKLGLFYLNQQDNEKALKLFNRIIESEPVFSEAAYYYRSCARTSKDEIEARDLISEMKIVEKMLKTRIECSLKSAQLIDWLKTNNNKNIIQIDSYKEQQQIVSNMYELFLGSIWNLIGHPVAPEEFCVISTKHQSEIDNEKINSIIFNDLIEEGIIKQQIKGDITDKDLSFTYEYGIYPESLKKLLDKCISDKVCSLEIKDYILNGLKKSVALPSREMFWKELVSAGILQNEEKYVFINHCKLNKIDPTLAEQIKDLAIDINPPSKNRVSLYLPEELGQLDESFTQCYYLFFKNVLKNKLGKGKFTFLKQENLMILNKQASFSCSVLETVKLNHFDNITLEDFLEVGIPRATAVCIIEDLIQEKIIGVEEKSGQQQYTLLVNSEELDKVKLSTHKTYLPDVKSLVSYHFAFRIALQKLQHIIPHCEGNYSNLCLPLRIKLYESLFYDLQAHEVIERTINIEKVNPKNLQSIYSKYLKKESCVRIFSKMYSKEKSERIVNDLINNNWLKKTFLPFGGSQVYCINNKSNEKDGTFVLEKPKKLSPGIESDGKTIELILFYYLYISNNVKSIEVILKNLAGSIYEVETPKLSPTYSLEMVLKERNISTSELNMFTLNGFDHIISLEEKKYTKRMKRNTFCITVLGLTEITFGAYLLLFSGNPFGVYFISQGIDDFIFVTSCLFSGRFSWKLYMLNKSMSLATSSLTCFVTLKSAFGSKSASLSLSTMKENCLGVLSNVKNPFRSEIKEMTRGEIVTSLCKRVVVHVAEGVAYGASFTLIDRVIQSQIEYLDESLTHFMYSNIDSDIDNNIATHSVFQASVELYEKLGKTKALTIIESSLCKINLRYQVKLEQTFDSINWKFIQTLIERTVSKGFNSECSDLSDVLKIIRTFHDVLTTIKSAWSHFQEVKTLVSDILSAVQDELCIESGEERATKVIELFELNQFKSEVKNMMQHNIKSIFSGHMKNKIISPILGFVGTFFEKYSVQMISKMRRSFLTDEEIFNFNRDKKFNFQTKNERKVEMKPDFFSFEFDEISCDVLKTRKNKKVFGYLLSQNTPVDMYCLELCCKVISFSLKEEGFDVPSLKVEVEKNGSKQVICIGDPRGEAPTIHITPDADLSSNLKSNKILIKDVFNFICKSFLEHYPEYKGPTAAVLQEMAVIAIDKYFCSSQPSGSSSDEGSQLFGQSSDPKSCKINTECERKTPYQHSHYGRGWIFNPCVDVDLREKDEFRKLIDIQKHVHKGFTTALGKINAHIHKIQNCLSSFDLILDDFAATKYQLTPPPPDSMSEIFHCYTVEYELIVPVILKGSNRLVDFSVKLQLEEKEPTNKIQPKSPLGPHILYEMNPVSNAKFINKGLKGHILLNIECRNTSYSVKDCHVAGELIVTSVWPKQETLRRSAISVSGHKECDIIIIGDSLFKYIENYISLPKCDYGKFPFVKYDLNEMVMSFLDNFTSIKCIILFLGNDIVRTNIPGQDLLDCLFNLTTKIQENIRNVKVIMCTLTFVKHCDKKKHCYKTLHKKISKTNKALENYCTKENVVLVDTNNIICPRDLGRDRIHLKRSGYHKLGNHLSKVCRGIMNSP